MKQHSLQGRLARVFEGPPSRTRRFRNLRSRGLGAVLAMALVPAFAIVSPFAASPASAASAVQKSDCQIHAVLASREGDGKVPKNLEFLRETLDDDAFAAYKGFHLIDKKTMKVALDKATESAFKSGHKLRLTLLGGDDGRLKFRADLTGRDGKTTLIGTDYSIEDNGLLMIQAGRYTSGEITGKLFFAIQCARRG
jgi:hypothetical protein